MHSLVPRPRGRSLGTRLMCARGAVRVGTHARVSGLSTRIIRFSYIVH